MALTLVVSDTFTEASNTNLTSHSSDTGGGSWAAFSGSGQVNASGDYAEDTNASNANRLNSTTALSVTEYDVIANITGSGTGFLTPAVAGRATSSTGRAAYEFGYSFNTGRWVLDDSVAATSATLTEAFPGAGTKIKLEIRTATKTGYVWDGSTWVQKCQLTTDSNSTGVYAGIKLSNFTGSTPAVQIDNFEIYEYTTGGGSSIAAISSGYHINGTSR